MRYKSTRGGVTDLSFKEALYSGFTEDGGLIMPETIPNVPHSNLVQWKNLPYTEIAKKIVSLFVDESEMTTVDLESLVDASFSKFTHPEVLPVRVLGSEVRILEMFHGRSWSFKDIALSCIGRLLEYFLAKENKRVTLLVSTTGDTGSAAIESVRGLPSVHLITMFPEGMVSAVQEKLMTSALDTNVHVFSVQGTGDDIDKFMKSVFVDAEFSKSHNLGSVNSINWARIMLQVVHYFYSYLRLSDDECLDEVDIIVPTGGCGNITAGILARMMGLPIRLRCAVNANDVVHRMLSKGQLAVAECLSTIAPAMDIQVPYNVERIWYLVTNKNTTLVADLMREFESSHTLTLPPSLVSQLNCHILSSASATNEDIRSCIRKVWNEDKYLICPHTATGMHLFLGNSTSPLPPSKTIILATASVMKFEEAVVSAGVDFPDFEEVKELGTRETRCSVMRKGEDWEQVLRDKICEISIQG